MNVCAVWVEVYVSLVMNNVTGKGQKYSLVKLYDCLETQLRSLKMLGVTSDAYASILYPLVESCLPSEILRVYERAQSTLIAQEKGDKKGDKLDQLMSFLRSEIESEQKVSLARTSFGYENKNKDSLAPRFQRGNVPSAADLFNNSENKNELKGNSCVFCDKTHLSQDCKYAKNMPYSKRKQILMERGVCFKCLRFKPRHISRFCKAKVSCSFCGGSHLFIMCQEKWNLFVIIK